MFKSAFMFNSFYPLQTTGFINVCAGVCICLLWYSLWVINSYYL